jgi:hypothetical protein
MVILSSILMQFILEIFNGKVALKFQLFATQISCPRNVLFRKNVPNKVCLKTTVERNIRIIRNVTFYSAFDDKSSKSEQCNLR